MIKTIFFTKKTFMFLAVLFFATAGAFSQDVITLRNGDEISATVQEIGIDDVTYNLKGQVYTKKQSEIFRIVLSNGEIVLFNNPPVTIQETRSAVNPNEQTWQIGYPTAANVTATYNKGTLTISGKGAMRDWNYNAVPWHKIKDEIKVVIINRGVIDIGNNAFARCVSLTSVNIPNSIKQIGESAFSGCSSLTYVTIPNSVTIIGKRAFAGCQRFTSINIPNSVISIGEETFFDCNSLTSVTVNWTIPPSIDNSVFAFIGKNLGIQLYVPLGTQRAYTSALVWQKFNIIERK